MNTPLKIVILDGYVANSNDLSWQPIANFGNLNVFDRTAPDEILDRCAGAEAVFTNKVVLDANTLEKLPNLKFIGVLATGYNNVDIDAASRLGITVCNVPAYSTDSVAQSVFALLLAITNRAESYSASVARGDWGNCKDFSYRLAPIFELSGAIMGIIGFGNIGSKVAEIAHAFGMKVITNSTRTAPGYIIKVSLNELLRQSDVISLNSALTPATERIINVDTIAMMKQGAILINTSRGGLIDEQALADAIKEGRLAAGVDVLNEEPPRHGSSLIGAPGCLVTPHVAWQSTQARRRLIDISAHNLAAYINGSPINVVSH